MVLHRCCGRLSLDLDAMIFKPHVPTVIADDGSTQNKSFIRRSFEAWQKAGLIMGFRIFRSMPDIHTQNASIRLKVVFLPPEKPKCDQRPLSLHLR